MKHTATRWLCRALLLNSFLLYLSTAWAGIHVRPQTLEFSDKTLRNDVRVFNDDQKNMAYVNITILNHNDSAGFSQEPNNNKPKPDFIPVPPTINAGLVVTPAKLVIAPGASRLVRIQLTKAPGDIERTYQVLVSPIQGDLITKKQGGNKVQAGIHLTINYGILTMVAPIHIQAKLALDRQGTKITAINSGNVSILLYDGQQCVANKCEKLTLYRVYPGKTLVFKVPAAAPVTFTQEYVGGGSSPIQSN